MRMIHPVNALTPRATFRGANQNRNGQVSNTTAIINACGVATVAGGLTTAVARGYTSSLLHAATLGLFGAFLTMFFMTPHLIDKIGMNRAAKHSADLIAKEDSHKAVDLVKEHLRPAKKLVQFRQQS